MWLSPTGELDPQNPNVVRYCLATSDYLNISNWLIEVDLLVKQQQAVIEYYETVIQQNKPQ